MDKLTSKQEQFCRNVAIEGMNQVTAYMTAYGYQTITKTIQKNSSALATQNSKIVTRIAELRERTLAKATSGLVADGIERRETLSMILRDSNVRDRDKISAIVELAKMENDYNVQIDTSVTVVQLKTFSIDELRLMIQQAKTIESDGIILEND